MPKVNKYKEFTRPLTIPDDDDPALDLHIRYRPKFVTPRLEREFGELEDGGDNIRRACEQFVLLVDSWDLTTEDDQPYPITVEALEDIPSQLLLLVFNKIRDDMRPNSERSSTSPNGSALTASEDRAQIGSSFSN